MAAFMLTNDSRWRCDSCFTRNNAAATECLCGAERPDNAVKSAPAPVAAPVPAPAPAPAPAAPAVVDFWAKAASDNRWKCDVCLVKNQQDKTICASCETPRPGAAAQLAAASSSSGTAATAGSKGPAFSFGFSAPPAPGATAASAAVANPFSFGFNAAPAAANGPAPATANNPFFAAAPGSAPAANPFFAAPARAAAAPAVANPFASLAKPTAVPASGGFNWGGLPSAPALPFGASASSSSNINAATSKKEAAEKKTEQLAAHDFFAALYDKQVATAAASTTAASSSGLSVPSEHLIHHPWKAALVPASHPQRPHQRYQRQLAYSWGNGDCEQLGQGEMDDFSCLLPSIITRLVRVPMLRIAAGGLHTLVLARDGKVWSWGCNDDGALGRPGGRENVPGVVRGLGTSRIVDVTAGDSHSLALNSEGRVFAWGTYKGAAGYLGFDPKTLKQTSPTSKISQLEKAGPIIAISSGADHSCVLTASGRVLTWGYGGQGQTGLSIPGNSDHDEELKRQQLTPRELALPAEIADELKQQAKDALSAAIASGKIKVKNAAAASSSGSPVSLQAVLSSGALGPYSSYYQAKTAHAQAQALAQALATSRLGAGGAASGSAAKRAKKGSKGAAGAGESESEAEDGQTSSSVLPPSQFGLGSLDHLTSPIITGAFAAGFSTFFSVKVLTASLSGPHGLAYQDRLYACGLNSYGQLGTNDLVNRSSFAEVKAIQPHLRLNAGSASASSSSSSSSSPVPQDGDVVLSVAGGAQHTVLLLGLTGRVCTFGRGDSGQLGLGENRNETLPVSASCLRPTVIPQERFATSPGGVPMPVLQVSANSCCSGCTTVDGGLFVWGFGENGQIGSGKDDKDENMPFATVPPKGPLSDSERIQQKKEEEQEEEAEEGEIVGFASSAAGSAAVSVGSKRNRAAAFAPSASASSLASSHIPVAIPSLPQDVKALGIGKRARAGDMRASDDGQQQPQARATQLSIGGQHCVALANGGFVASKLMPAVKAAEAAFRQAVLTDGGDREQVEQRVTAAFGEVFNFEEDPKPEDLSSDEGDGGEKSGSDSSSASESETESEGEDEEKEDEEEKEAAKTARSTSLALVAAPAPAPVPAPAPAPAAAWHPFIAISALAPSANGGSTSTSSTSSSKTADLDELRSLADSATQPNVRLMLQGVALLFEGFLGSAGFSSSASASAPAPAPSRSAAAAKPAASASSKSSKRALMPVVEEQEEEGEAEHEGMDGDADAEEEEEEGASRPAKKARGGRAATSKSTAASSAAANKKKAAADAEKAPALAVGSKRKAPTADTAADTAAASASASAASNTSKRGGKAASATASAAPSAAKRARKA